MVEIKSAEQVRPDMVKPLIALGRSIDKKADLVLLSCDPVAQNIEGVRCLYWQDGLRDLFTGPDIRDYRSI